MKLTKSQLIQNINEELSSDEIQQILNYMEPIFSGINSNRKIMDKNVQILQAKINKVDETGLLRLRHYEQTGEVMVQPFREPEGTGELGELPQDAEDTMRDPGDTRSLGPDAPEDELDPNFMPTEGKAIKLTNSKLKQIIKEKAMNLLDETRLKNSQHLLEVRKQLLEFAAGLRYPAIVKYIKLTSSPNFADANSSDEKLVRDWEKARKIIRDDKQYVLNFIRELVRGLKSGAPAPQTRSASGPASSGLPGGGNKPSKPAGASTGQDILKTLEHVIKEELELVLLEHAKNYVWGVKGPGRVANQYSLRPFHSTEK